MSRVICRCRRYLCATLVVTSLGFQSVSSQVAWPAAGPELCMVPAGFPIRPDSTCADFGEGSSCGFVLDVAAQRGEVETAQLLLRQSSDLDSQGGLTNVTVTVQGVPKSVAQISVFQVGYVYAKHSPRYRGSGGGWRPDPLLPPPADRGFDVAPDQSQAIYIELTVQYDAAPGHYNGTVVIACDGKPCLTHPLQAPLRLTVWDTQLPTLAQSRLGAAWNGGWTPSRFAPYYGDAYFANRSNRQQWFDLLIKARVPPDGIYQSPTTLRPMSDYLYLVSKGVKQFAILDVTSLPLEPGGAVPQAAQMHPSGHGTRKLQGSCANYTDEYVQRLITVLDPLVHALEEAGIADRAYIYGFDEQPAECEPQVRKLFGATKRAYPNLRTAAVLNWSPMPVDLPVDIWILQYQLFNTSDASTWVSAGKTQWLYHCIEPEPLKYLNTFLERRPVQARLLFWLAALLQAETGTVGGWLYYEVNLWRPCESAACGGAHTPQVMRRKEFIDTADTRHGFRNLAYTDFPPANFIWQPTYNDIHVNGDGQYLYPCEGGPCSTTRLSAIRDGLEDWEMFARLPRSQAIPLLRRLVRSSSDWTEDPVLLEKTRREAAHLLNSGTPAQAHEDIVV